MNKNSARPLRSWLSVLAASVILTGSLAAQPTEPAPSVVAVTRFEPEQLEELLGPIALYPDALIALILPASTATSDVVLAARFLRDGGDVTQVESQPWDDSVQALTRYADVVKWMDENLAWTKQLGEAFLAQPADVMNAVQRLRAKAQAAGNLVNTAEQQIVIEQSAISIVPAQPDVIYVPYYDPEIIYVPQPVHYAVRPYFSFSRPYSTGFWLSFNLDWHQHRVWCVDRNDRERYWRETRQYWHRPSHWGQPGYAARPSYYRPWAPRAHHVATHRSTTVRHTAVARPRFAGGAGSRFDDEPNRVDGTNRSPRNGHTYTSRSASTTHVRGTPRTGSLSTGPSAGASTIPHLNLAQPLPQTQATVSRQTPSTPVHQRRDRTAQSPASRANQPNRSGNDGDADGQSQRGSSTHRVTRSAPRPNVGHQAVATAPVNNASPYRPGQRIGADHSATRSNPGHRPVTSAPVNASPRVYPSPGSRTQHAPAARPAYVPPAPARTAPVAAAPAAAPAAASESRGNANARAQSRDDDRGNSGSNSSASHRSSPGGTRHGREYER